MSAAEPTRPRAVLVTGASGYVGRQLVAALAAKPEGLETIVALDVREERARLPGVSYETLDIRAPELGALLARHGVDVVVHLAAIVTPPPGMSRETQRSIDVDGTANVLAACVANGVERIIVSSSGAAYGYHADAPAWIDEDTPLRGNREFAYSDHKREVEALLASFREAHPELKQLVFRVGTVLGAGVANQITALFERPVVLGLSDASTPFVFVWDQDLVALLESGVRGSLEGIYNVAGDGVLTLREIAALLGKPFVGVPSALLERALSVLSRRGVVPYGPEQVRFLRYRPVLANTRLKEEYGFRPRRSTREAFEAYAAARPRA